MIYPTANNPPRPALNAIAPVTLQTDPASETGEQQTVRHLRLCQELIDRGMHLARIAADRAEQDMLAPPPAPMPASAAAAIDQAEARARLRNPNHAATFARLARTVRQTIALQAHIKAGRPFLRPQAPHHPTPAPPPTARRPNRPDLRPAFRLDAADPPDWLPPTSPDNQIPVETLLQTITNSFGTNLPAETPAQPNPKPTPPQPLRTRPPNDGDHAIARNRRCGPGLT